MGAWKPPTGVQCPMATASSCFNTWGRGSPQLSSGFRHGVVETFQYMGAWKPPTSIFFQKNPKKIVSIHGGVEAPNRDLRRSPAFLRVSIHGGVEAPNTVDNQPESEDEVSIHGGVEAPNLPRIRREYVMEVSIHGGVEAPNLFTSAAKSSEGCFNTWGRGSPQPGFHRCFDLIQPVSIHGGVEAPNSHTITSSM